MNNFIEENFLLQNDRAVELYHRFARDLPIIDFHSHLPTRQIAEDCRFANLTRIWLDEDHYKWRAMRWAGVAERYCTGDATDWEKFQKWAEVVPKTLRNPLYHWTHLELKRAFGIGDRLLGPQTAQGIWDQCAALLAGDNMSCRSLMRQFKVALVCTTDDPVDSLEHHAAIARDSTFPIRVLPTFRPDRALAIGAVESFNHYVDRLAEASRIDIGDALPCFVDALRARHDYFHAAGCRLSDHGMETIDAAGGSVLEFTAVFARVRRGDCPSAEETAQFRWAMLHEMALWDHHRGWTQQFHLGPTRNNRTRIFQQFGPDAGCDSIADLPYARGLVRFLDRLDQTDQLPKTIIYNLDPSRNEVVAAVLGNFQDGSMPGKLQLGSAWWFNDQKDGIEKQINCLSNLGLLSCFVGMLTDSRSFLSFTRHEYFRRVLCNLLGGDMRQGLLPDDLDLIGGLVRDVCHDNARRYFGFEPT